MNIFLANLYSLGLIYLLYDDISIFIGKLTPAERRHPKFSTIEWMSPHQAWGEVAA